MKAVSVRFGNLKSRSATAVAMSLVNTSVVLTVNGLSYTITMSAVGDDRSEADEAESTTLGYAGSTTVVLPAEFTQVSWSATQGTSTDSGTLWTCPRASDDFAFATTTCFNPHGDSAITAWDFLNYYRTAGDLPLVAVLHSDDIYYEDGAGASTSLQNGYFDANGKGPEAVGIAAQTAYDYAFYYGCWFLICGPLSNGFVNAAADNAAFGELMSNVAFMPQWGDHEFRNNIGWYGGMALTTVPNPYHKTEGGFDGNGLTVYNALMAPLQGTRARNADAAANHWYADIGCVRYIAADPVTNAVSETSCYGTNQITDILNTANCTQPFKVLSVSAIAGRGFEAYVALIPNFVYKDENFIESEYNALIRNTGATPKSLMDNPRTNGITGNTVVVRGDWHGAAVFYWHGAADTGIAAESFYEIGLCSVNSSVAGGTCVCTTPGDLETYHMTLAGGRVKDFGQDSKESDNIATLFEVYGSRTPKEVIIRQYDIYDASFAGTYVGDLGTVTDTAGNVWKCVFEKKLSQWSDNQGIAPEATGVVVPSSAVGVSDA